MVQIVFQQTPADIRKSAARFRYLDMKDVQLIAVKNENDFMSRKASFIASGGLQTSGTSGASVGTFDVKESLNVLLKLRSPFHWLPGLMKDRFLKRRFLLRLEPLK